MAYTMLFEEQILIYTTLIILIVFMIKIVDDILNIIINNMIIVKGRLTTIDTQETTIKDLLNKIVALERKVDQNWVFLSEEVNDIYPSIKAINTEIMYIKNKME